MTPFFLNADGIGLDALQPASGKKYYRGVRKRNTQSRARFRDDYAGIGNWRESCWAEVRRSARASARLTPRPQHRSQRSHLQITLGHATGRLVTPARHILPIRSLPGFKAITRDGAETPSIKLAEHFAIWRPKSPSNAEGPMVRRLTAGGKWIRTLGPP